MPRHLHLDFETFSKADIRDVGAYRYAFDPSTEILCAAMAFDDEEPVVWHCEMADWEQDHLQLYWGRLQDPDILIYAHNAMFESAICQALLMKTCGIPAPALERFRCTMSLARRASLPGKLEKLAEVLKLGNQKDTRGKSLLKKFSMMQPAKKPTLKNPNGLPPRRILPNDEPEAFAELLAYCAQDVRAEQEVARKLAYFDEPINNRNYTLDQRINARGVPVNLAALRHAQKLIDEETEIVSAKFRELTGFEVTQNAVLLKWLKERGYTGEDLQAETIESLLEKNDTPADPPRKVNYAGEHGGTYTVEVVDQRMNGEAVMALRLKQSIAYASIKKVKTMLECAGPHDNRIRGMLNHHGATTGRWTASLVQFQNMKRPTIKHSEDAYREICEGVSREMLEICYGPVLEVISSCIRHFVHDTL
jgi:DNA polymerase bacteriophage-type